MRLATGFAIDSNFSLRKLNVDGTMTVKLKPMIESFASKDQVFHRLDFGDRAGMVKRGSSREGVACDLCEYLCGQL